MAIDPWSTLDTETPEGAVEARAMSLEEKGFRRTLIDRAKKRLNAVSETGPSAWMVEGNPALGDTRPVYGVLFTDTPKGKRYSCDCFDRLYGEVRRARMCSHVLAVMLWRSGKRVAGKRQPEADSDHAIDKTVIPPPGDPIFAGCIDDPPLPGWVKEIRPHQWRAAVEIVGHFEAGKKCVILDACTGSGKSLLGELVRRVLKTRALYLCTTLSLQDQFVGDFGYSCLLKGRRNYPTLDFPDEFGPPKWLTAADCDKRKVQSASEEDGEDGEPTEDGAAEESAPKYYCSWCSDVSRCPYECAKAVALDANLTTTNTSYFLTEANYVGGLSDWPLVIIDEADTLEQSLMSFIEVDIPAKWQKRLQLGKPARVTMPDHWEEWIAKTVPKVQKAQSAYSPSGSLEQKRDRKALDRLEKDLRRVEGRLSNGTWVYCGDETPHGQRIVFKPVTVDRFGGAMLWENGQRFLLMSATIISAQQIAQDLGLSDGEWASVTVDSTFPADRRPIYPISAANLTYKTEDQEWPKAVAAIDRILDQYPGSRCLIHTVSYIRTRRLLRESRHKERMLTYANATERTRAIDALRETPGAILVAPSLERGVDLPDGDCEVVIVLKVPYVSTGDRQVKARMGLPGGKGWYTVQAVRALVQMTGRGMRHAQDRCHIWLIDSQFERVYQQSRDLFPVWWRRAVMNSNPLQNGRGDGNGDGNRK